MSCMLHWALQELFRHTSPKDDSNRFYWSYLVGRGRTGISIDSLKFYCPLAAEFTEIKHLQTPVPK